MMSLMRDDSMDFPSFCLNLTNVDFGGYNRFTGRTMSDNQRYFRDSLFNKISKFPAITALSL